MNAVHSLVAHSSGRFRAAYLFSAAICVLPVTGLADAVPAGGNASETNAGFRACIAGLQKRARDSGISDAVVRDVLGGARYQARVIELDRQQPEFMRTFTDYYSRRVTQERVDRGRELLRRHRELLEDVQRRYGVPKHYLLAFWGLETNFGAYFGKIAVPDALATLACDERRSEFFMAELLAALRIIDAGDIPADRMLGSWAGAMGNFQFLPSVFLRHAVDADGDGRRDLWQSLPDALNSAGRFLEDLGWQRGLRWGREVILPDTFDYALAGRDTGKPLRDWADLGITDAYGNALPSMELPASVLVPAGHEGPAFIVYENFDVIMRWNRSEFYAIAVGRLADRIAGAGELTRPLPADASRLTRAQVEEIQVRLASLGYDPGQPDGILGRGTRRALSAFQRDRGVIADGYLDAELLEAVLTAAP